MANSFAPPSPPFHAVHQPPGGRANFADQSEWITVRDVPLIDSHVLTDQAGQPKLPIDEQFLRQVAANNNARFHRSGDATPGVIGHTSDDPTAPERPVRCWFTGFKVRPFNGKPTLFADQHVKRKYANIIEDYPRRSIELWVGKREIDPIALLGGTTPERDLGITKYGRESDELVIRFNRRANDHVYSYSLEPPMTVPHGYPPPGGYAQTVTPNLFGPNGRPVRYAFDEGNGDGPPPDGGGDDNGGGDDPMVAKILASAAFKAAIREAVDQALGEADQGDEDMPPEEGDMAGDPGAMPPPGGPPMPPGAQGGMPGAPPPMPEAAGFHGPPPVKFNEGMGYPTGSNTFIPESAPSRMSRHGDSPMYPTPAYGVRPYYPPANPHFARQPEAPATEGRMAKIEQENRALKLRLARADAMEYVRGTLMEREGLKIDDPQYLAEQLANFEFVPNGIAARNEFIEKVVRKNFARREHDPAHTMDIMRYSRSDTEASQAAQGPQTHEQVMGLVKYAREHKIGDMAVAWAQMNGKK